jgi:hypothetical protein
MASALSIHHVQPILVGRSKRRRPPFQPSERHPTFTLRHGATLFGHCHDNYGRPASHIVAFENRDDATETMRRLGRFLELFGRWPDQHLNMFRELGDIDSMEGPARQEKDGYEIALDEDEFERVRKRIMDNCQGLDLLQNLDFESHTNQFKRLTLTPLYSSRKLMLCSVKKAYQLKSPS